MAMPDGSDVAAVFAWGILILQKEKANDRRFSL